jgi:hypothetical protein
VPQNITLDILIDGSGFDQGSSVSFAIDAVVEPRLRVNSTRYQTSGRLSANVTIAADAPIAAYDIIVTTAGGKKGIGSEKLFVEGAIPEAPAAVQSLGTLDGEEAGFVGDINDAGYIVGWARSCCGTPSKTWIWNPTTEVMLEIGTGTVSAVNADLTVQGGTFLLSHLGGSWARTRITLPSNADTITSYATSMNNSGTMAGLTTVGDVKRATVWPSPTDFYYLDPVDPSWTESWGVAINDNGWVAGFSRSIIGSKGKSPTSQRNGFVWIPDAVGARTGCNVLLPAFNGSLSNTPVAMNNRGQVVGYSQDGNNQRIVLWEVVPGGTTACPYTSLPPRNLGAGYSAAGQPTDINDAGTVAGWYYGRQEIQPFVWDAGHGFRGLPADPLKKTIPRSIQNAPAGQPYVVAGERTTAIDPRTSVVDVVRWTVAH